MEIQVTIYKNEASISTEDGRNYYADDAQLVQIQDSNNEDELWQLAKNVDHRGTIITDWDQVNMANVIAAFGYDVLGEE